MWPQISLFCLRDGENLSRECGFFVPTEALFLRVSSPRHVGLVTTYADVKTWHFLLSAIFFIVDMIYHSKHTG